METIEESYGYITKQLIKDNDIIKDSEIDYVLKLFRNQIKEIYDYKPPTKIQMEQFDLKNRKYIYVRREQNGTR